MKSQLDLKAEQHGKTLCPGYGKLNNMTNYYHPRPLECHSKINRDLSLK